MDRNTLIQQLKTLKDEKFEALALAIFQYQAKNNPIYAKYLALLNIKQTQVQRLADIPFLPIQLFKKYQLQSGQWTPSRVFSSSGTTGSTTSQHLLKDDLFYRENARRGFEQFYGAIQNYTILALLPSYLERQGSSLIFMAQDFIKQSEDKKSGFFLHNHADLIKTIDDCQQNGRKILLLGVSFALLDLAEQYPKKLSNTIIMETGGMKGKRKEITREALHSILKKAFNQPVIHSEYGMTELLSQAYSKGDGLFRPSSNMRILIRELTDPMAINTKEKTGAINIIDLANIDTISFIATDDLGVVYADNSFKILGRIDVSDMRGCNLMVR